MIAKLTRTFVVGALVAVSSIATPAQEVADVAKNDILLQGVYQIERMEADSTTVSMSFTATIMNNGPRDLSGKIALNNPSVIQKIYNQFGDQSIPAGGKVVLSDNVTVPRDEYNAWLQRGPNLTFYAQNDRGEMKTFRIPLTGKAPAPSGK